MARTSERVVGTTHVAFICKAVPDSSAFARAHDIRSVNRDIPTHLCILSRCPSKPLSSAAGSLADSQCSGNCVHSRPCATAQRHFIVQTQLHFNVTLYIPDSSAPPIHGNDVGQKTKQAAVRRRCQKQSQRRHRSGKPHQRLQHEHRPQRHPSSPSKHLALRQPLHSRCFTFSVTARQIPTTPSWDANHEALFPIVGAS